MITPDERMLLEEMFVGLQAIHRRLALHCQEDEHTLFTVYQMLGHCTRLLRAVDVSAPKEKKS